MGGDSLQHFLEGNSKEEAGKSKEIPVNNLIQSPFNAAMQRKEKYTEIVRDYRTQNTENTSFTEHFSEFE